MHGLIQGMHYTRCLWLLDPLLKLAGLELLLDC